MCRRQRLRLSSPQRPRRHPSRFANERASKRQDFVGRFNARDLAGLTSLFTVDARTLWVRRGEPVTSDGEVLAYDRIERDPSPTMQYAEGTGQLFAAPRFVGSRGMFPDGVVRGLSTKFVYSCGQRGIVQLDIAPTS